MPFGATEGESTVPAQARCGHPQVPSSPAYGWAPDDGLSLCLGWQNYQHQQHCAEAGADPPSGPGLYLNG